eukprot:jgi/Chrpa1/5312/Chrysochromulina_OHIO_Genome00013211-RA
MSGEPEISPISPVSPAGAGKLRAYVKQHAIEPLLAEALKAACDTGASDPVSFIGNFMLKKAAQACKERRLSKEAVAESEYLRTTALGIASQRTCWLLFFMFGLLLTANVLHKFEALLERELELAFFVPLLIGAGGNSGGQTVSTVIRALGSGSVKLSDAPRIIAKEGLSGLLQAFVLVLVLAPSLRLVMDISEDVTVVVCLTLLGLGFGANSLASALTFFVAWMGKDPAVIVGPLMTTSVDSIGLMSYLAIATLYISSPGGPDDVNALGPACKRNWHGVCIPANEMTPFCKGNVFSSCKPPLSMTKKKHAKAPSVQENYYVCAPCGKECSGETSLLQHCMGLEHFRRVGHRGFAGCIPNKLGQIPPLSDEFFVRIAQGPAGLEQVPPEGPMSEYDPLTQQPAGGLGGGGGSSGFDGAAPTTAASAAQTDKFFQTLYRCAACGTTVSGHISFVEHCRGKAHIKKAGFSGFAGLLPNDAGIIPPVPPQLLASMPAAQPAMPDFAVAAAAAAAALVAAGDSGAPGAASGTAPAVAAAPAVPPPVKEKKAVSVRMNQASLAALSRAASNHDREKITGKGPSAGERAAEKAAKAAARALERNKHGGNRAGPVPQLEVPFGPFAADRAKLPIANFRETVLQTMRANQVTVLQGDTGCGKTTQVPQFILEEAAATGTHISIVCTQPRRISAMGVAERVAQERGEALGRTVGYAIRLENKSSSATRLLFCTTGILLRRLEEDPTLQGTTHVVVDEVHERSVESDFLLMVLRDTLRDQRPDLRLPPAGQGDPESSYGEAQAVLVFLQGIKEIVAVQDALLCTREYSQEPARSWVLAVHSSVPPEEQRMAFKRPPPGVRKVVLATNIAETAITIDDVSFVIDCCRMKENRYDPATRMESLDDVPISQANAKQRRGRAGRCRPGVAFHLVTKRTLDAAPTHQAPEVQRMPLDRLILAIKALNYDRSAANVCAALIEPPSPAAVQRSIADLCDLEALSRTTVKVKPAVEAEDGKEAQEAEFEIGEELTSLGLHLSRLPVDVHIGKLILLGAIFNRTNDVLTIAATLSTRTPFLSPVQRREEADQAKRRFAFNQSDHLTMLRAYNEWDALSGNAKFDFCRENFLGVRTLQSISGLKRQLLELLCDAGFVKSSTPLRVRAVEALGRREDGSDGVKLALVGFLSGEGVCPHCSKEAGAQDMGGGMGGGMGGMHGQMSAQMGGQMGSGMMHSASFESGLSSFGAAEAERLRLNEAAAAQMDADGKLLVIALEREETKKKKGMNAPVKLRIRDRNEDGTGASDPVEVALHPSSVNASHEKAIASSYLIYHEKVRTTRVYVRDCSPVSAYALILFGGVLSSQPGVPPPPPPVTKKNRHRPPPPQVAKDGILVIDGWIMFSVSVQEQRLLLGVRQKLDELLASKIDSPELEVAEAGKELLSAVSQVLASN